MNLPSLPDAASPMPAIAPITPSHVPPRPAMRTPISRARAHAWARVTSVDFAASPNLPAFPLTWDRSATARPGSLPSAIFSRMSVFATSKTSGRLTSSPSRWMTAQLLWDVMGTSGCWKSWWRVIPKIWWSLARTFAISRDSRPVPVVPGMSVSSSAM